MIYLNIQILSNTIVFKWLQKFDETKTENKERVVTTTN
jgi:hypothetical protein